MNRGKREAKPYLLKAGFAFVLSLAGFFVSRYGPRPRRKILPPPSLPPSSDVDLQLGVSVKTLDEGLAIAQNADNFAKITPGAADPACVEGESPFCSDNSGEEEEFPGFVLPEWNKLVRKEQEAVPETFPVTSLTEDYEIRDTVAMEEEIKYLRNLVLSLQERERCLEIHLFEYHGLKEQEVSMSELQNRLKINATESKLLSVKIDALKAENEKLRVAASDYSRVAAELDMQRESAALLESRLESVSNEANEKIAVLYERITDLRDREKKELENATEVEMKLKRLNEVEHEVMGLRKENSRLLHERSDLLQKLTSGHLPHSSVIRSSDSVLNNIESGRSTEELNHLREENERLNKEMDQLQTDRCADLEELVYLKWLNACLRYELRNHNPDQGKTLARDLNRCLSPNSELKVKQLILEYSNSGFDLDVTSSINFDFEDCSSDASSEDTDELSLGSMNTKSSKSSKSRFLGKLKRLVLGKIGNNTTRVELCADENGNVNGSLPLGLPRASMGMHNLGRLGVEESDGAIGTRCKSDLGEVYGRRRMISVDGCLSGSTCVYVENEEGDPEKVKLMKYAQVLKSSHQPLKMKRRSASVSFA